MIWESACLTFALSVSSSKPTSEVTNRVIRALIVARFRQAVSLCHSPEVRDIIFVQIVPLSVLRHLGAERERVFGVRCGMLTVRASALRPTLFAEELLNKHLDSFLRRLLVQVICAALLAQLVAAEASPCACLLVSLALFKVPAERVEAGELFSE